MAKLKVPDIRRRDFSGLKLYKSYIESLENLYTAVDGTSE